MKREAGIEEELRFTDAVFDDEPLAPEHPLRLLPNTVLTPHVGYVTVDNYRDWFGTAVRRIASWHSGTPESVLTP